MISGLTVIAQSHIALHYFIDEKIAYIDIFSCSFINCDNIKELVEKKLGFKVDDVLVSRGSKHLTRFIKRDEVIRIHKKWKDNI